MKQLFFIVIFALATTCITAQEQPKFGIKGAFNLTSYRANVTVHTGTEPAYERLLKPGYQLGAFVNKGLSPKIEVQFEILFDSKGARLQNHNTNNRKAPFSYRADWLSLPLIMKYKFGKKWKGLIGMEYGSLLQYHIGLDEDHSEYEPFKTQVHSNRRPVSNWGVVIGLERNINEQINIGWRYARGLQKVITFQVDDTFGPPSDIYWKTVDFQIYATYTFKSKISPEVEGNK